jgi:hypothetical protein
MKTRRHTVNSDAPLSGNESLDMFPPTSSAEQLTTTSSAAQLTTTSSAEELTTTTLKSDVWEHFERCINLVPLKAKCLLCQEELLTPNYGTSSLKRHLMQRHGLKQFGLTEVSRLPVIPVSLSRSEKQKLDELAIVAIIQDARSYGDLQKTGLKKFIDALKPGKSFFRSSLNEPYESGKTFNSSD